MSGPSLALGVNAKGQETLVGLNEQLSRLRENLAALKGAGKADLSGLSSAAAEIKKFRTEFADSNAGLRTSFAELAEAIKGGFSKVSSEAETSGKKVRSIVSKERAGLQAEYEKYLADGVKFTNDQLRQMQDSGIRLVAAQSAMLKAQRVAAPEKKALLANDTFSNPRPPSAKDTEIEAAWAAYSKTTADSVAASKASAWVRAESVANAEISAAMVQSDKGFAEIAKQSAARRIAAAEAAAAVEAKGIAAAEAFATKQILADRAEADARYAAGLKASSDIRQAAQTKARQEDAAWASRAPKSSINDAWEKVEKERSTAQANSFKQASQGFKAIEMKAAAERVAAHESGVAAEIAGIKAADAFAEANQREQLAKRKAAAKAYADTQAEVQALRERDQKLDAAFAASNERGRMRVLVSARSQLDQGLPAARVQQNFGPQAAGLAQAASSLKMLQGELGTAPTKIKIATSALNDLHSAARGVASGFGAMFLTWGNIAPLLAGAALSNAFVQTVKLGSSVGQTLATIKELGGNTVGEVAKVKTSLLELSAQGPFGPLEVAEAFKTLSLAGLTAQQQVAAIKDVLNFAVAGDLPITKAAEGLVTISTAFGYSAENYGRVADVVAKAAATSIASVEGMTQAFGTSAALSQQFGVSLEDLAVQLALVNNAGTRNQAAGTAVKNFYQTILSDAPKVTKALKSIDFDPRQLDGKVKGTVQMITELNKALGKKDEKGRQIIIDVITNERGNKSLAASLAAANKMVEVAQADGSKIMMTGVEALKKQIEEAYGFSAIAASYMSLTAANQIKGVFSALQSSLVSSFDAIEPSVLQVASTLKTAFNSDEFKATIQGLASSVANLTVFLVDHATTLGYVIAGYVAFKGAMVAFSAAAAAGAAITTLTAAWTAMRTPMLASALLYPVLNAEMVANTAVVATNTAATAGNSIAQRASAAATTLAGAAARLAAGGFAFLRVAMGPIAFILGGIATAWLLYKSTTAEANVTTADAATLIGTELVESLKKEADRLEARNKLIREGTEARQADMIVQQAQAQAELSAQQVKGAEPLQKAVDEAQARYQIASTGVDPARPGGSKSYVAGASDKDREAARRDLAAAQAALQDYKTRQDALRYQANEEQYRIREESRKQEEDRRAKAKANERQPGTEPFNKTRPDPTAFTGRKREFAEEMSLITQRYGDEQKLLDLKNKNKLISDAAYAFQSEQIAEAQYRDEIANLNKYINESAGLLAAMKAKNKGGRATAEESDQEAKGTEYKQKLDFLKAQADIKKQGSDKKLDDSFEKETAKLNQTVTIARAQQQVAQDTANLTEKQVAYYTAENTALASSNEFLREKKAILTQLQGEVARASDASQGPVDDPYVQFLEKKVGTLQEQLDAFTVARNKDAAALGQIAADNAQPNWQKMLEGFKNTVQQMESAYNEVVEGFVTKGQTIFADIFKTGRISLKSLLDLVQDVLVKQIYQTQIAPLFTNAGKAVAGALFPQGASNPNYSNEGNNFKIGGVDTAAANTSTALTTLQSTGIVPATTSFGSLVLAVEAAVNKLWSLATSAGGSSGGGGIVGQFLGGSSGAGTGGDGWTTNPQAGAAHGNVYGSAYAFAKGGAFTNSVVTGRTPFHFKNGGKFSRGEMGEAGPEAIMPLKRGANGALGVAMVGGGGGNNTSVEVHNYGDGKARTQETKNPDGSRIIRVIVDQAKREVAGDIQRGGLIGDAVETQYGMNRANGLPRR